MIFKSASIILQLAILAVAIVAMLNSIAARENSFRHFVTYCAQIDNINPQCRDWR